MRLATRQGVCEQELIATGLRTLYPVAEVANAEAVLDSDVQTPLRLAERLPRIHLVVVGGAEALLATIPRASLIRTAVPESRRSSAHRQRHDAILRLLGRFCSLLLRRVGVHGGYIGGR